MCIFVKKNMRLLLGLILLFVSSCNVYKEKCDGVSENNSKHMNNVMKVNNSKLYKINLC